jgi:hypothetical protein
VSSVIFGRWSLAGLGTTIDLNGRIAADPRFEEVSGYGQSFFDVSAGPVAIILIAFLVAFLIAAVALARGRVEP